MGDVRVPELNQVTIAGRLTRDPDLKYTQSGRACATISIANSQSYKDKNDERKENVTFVDVTLWDKMAEYVDAHMKKGSPVLVEGRLKSDQWEDKNSGQKRSKVLIAGQRVFPLEWKDKGDGGPQHSNNHSGESSRPNYGGQHQSQHARHEDSVPEDDTPF